MTFLTICWTSGTTGTPKGVPRSTNHWLAISHASRDLAELRDGDVLLNPFPLVNMGGIGGFLFNWLKCQGTLVLHHPMNLPVFLDQLQTERVNYTIAPPPLLNALLQDEQLLANRDLTHLRAVGSGSCAAFPMDDSGLRRKVRHRRSQQFSAPTKGCAWRPGRLMCRTRPCAGNCFHVSALPAMHGATALRPWLKRD